MKQLFHLCMATSLSKDNSNTSKEWIFLALKRINQVYKGPTILYKTQMTLISHLRLTWKAELLHEILLDG